MSPRRGTARRSFARRRIRRIRDKWDPAVIPRRFKKLELVRRTTLTDALDEYVGLEPELDPELTVKGVPADQWPYYYGFSKRMLNIYERFSGATLQEEKTSLITEYVSRGYSLPVLEQLQDVVEEYALEPDYLFAGFEGSPGDIDLLNVSMLKFTKIAERDDIYSGMNYLVPGIYDGMGWADPGIINYFHPKTLSWISSLTLNPGDGYIWGFAETGNNLYAGTSTQLIVKCTKSPLARVAALNVAEGVNGTLIIDGDIMYCITALQAVDKVIKIDLPSFTKGAVLALGQQINDYLRADAVISGGFLYVGIPRDPGRIVKVNLTTFLVDSTLTLGVNEAEARGLVVKEGYLYAGCWEAPGKIVKIDLSTFTKVATLTLAAGEDIAYDMQIVDNTLYVLCYDYYLVRINLTTFTRIDALNLGTGAIYATDLIVATTKI